MRKQEDAPNPPDSLHRKGTGIALSGGGFRATLFHLGALWRLNELGLLSKLDRIVGISGGAILAAHAGLRWRSLSFSDNVAKNFRAEIVDPIRRFCSSDLDVRTYALRVLPRPWAWRRAGNALAAAYRNSLYGAAVLDDLPKAPAVILGATNLLSGGAFRFS